MDSAVIVEPTSRTEPITTKSETTEKVESNSEINTSNAEDETRDKLTNLGAPNNLSSKHTSQPLPGVKYHN